VEYADHVEIATPEGVDLEVELAGLGSRFLGELIDYAAKGLLIGALALILLGIANGVATAIFIVASFLVWFGYDVLFEVLANGRTPGKSAIGIRVVRTGGQPVGFLSSSVRNLVRLVDGPLTSYVAGMVSIIVSKRNQRLGDMAAGTLVVREPPAPKDSGQARAASPGMVVAYPPPPPPPDPDAPQWDVSAVTQQELAAVRQFLSRRHTLEAVARRRIATQLAEGLGERVAGAPPDLAPEDFLEQLAQAKSARVR
jgi:uncharacterized RDD family membrane protein YckC